MPLSRIWLGFAKLGRPMSVAFSTMDHILRLTLSAAPVHGWEGLEYSFAFETSEILVRWESLLLDMIQRRSSANSAPKIEIDRVRTPYDSTIKLRNGEEGFCSFFPEVDDSMLVLKSEHAGMTIATCGLEGCKAEAVSALSALKGKNQGEKNLLKLILKDLSSLGDLEYTASTDTEESLTAWIQTLVATSEHDTDKDAAAQVAPTPTS